MLILLARRHGGCLKLWGQQDSNAAERSAEYPKSEAFTLQDQRRTGPQGVSPSGTTANAHDLMSTKTSDNTREAGLEHDAGNLDQFSAEYEALQDPVSEADSVFRYRFLYLCVSV